MGYKIGGTTSQSGRVVIVKESDWDVEISQETDAGAYTLYDLDSSQKTVINRLSTGESISYGNVTPIYHDPVVPVGLIAPLDDTSIPAGWERFTSSDDRTIIGAGASYNPGDNGGSDTAVLSTKTSSTNGAHTGNSGTDYPTPAGGGNECGGSLAGNHSHDFTASGYLAPEYRQMILIKATSIQPQIPAKVCTLWHNPAANPTGLTQQYTADDDKMFRGASAIGTGGNNQLTVTSSSDGIHAHGTGGLVGGGPQEYTGSLSGGHTHDVDLTVTFNPKEVLLGLWTDASANFEMATNFIGMYESLTPPNGWVLCDGNNGTPDMRDFFLGISNQAKQGTSQGDDTMSGVTPSHSWTHNHREISGSPENGACTWMHTTQSHPHAHTLIMDNTNYFPPYYSLSFIMFVGV